MAAVSSPARTSAVVLAGGLGTRLAPLTDNTPKPLLPVAGEPVVAHQLRWLAAAGVTRVVLTTSYRAEQFAPTLGDGSAYGVHLTYCHEEHPLGTGGALVAAVDRLAPAPGETLLVLNGDQLTGHDVRRQLFLFQDARSAQGCVASIHARPVDDARAYGLLSLDAHDRVLAFEEKPLGPDPVAGIVNAGTYVLDPACLRDVPRGEVVSFERDVMPALLRNGAMVTAYVQDAYGVDVGTPETLVAASRDAVLRSGPALIDPGASVDPTASVLGGSYVGPGAQIGAAAVVDGSIVMADAHVGAGVVVQQSVVGQRAQVESPIILQDNVIGDDALVEAGHGPEPGERVPTGVVLPRP
ncbi:NDP-sugar synthase [Allobranchiibius sp. CTAmp26]|uniref:nucleotidyltransferase family protein n=1 Tax=Allobranchiibius sp. CTAmp26 TaxID=2815214 RepID=UPI001AA1D2D2|nr:NDP-sugar synthase [Allobranchiibius sp. CTAmp26]MBO1754059.1 NDP-sugar synthase [Allobranchiibius sp. CTAmp26]